MRPIGASCKTDSTVQNKIYIANNVQGFMLHTVCHIGNYVTRKILCFKIKFKLQENFYVTKKIMNLQNLILCYMIKFTLQKHFM